MTYLESGSPKFTGKVTADEEETILKSCNCYCASSVTSHDTILKQKNMQ